MKRIFTLITGVLVATSAMAQAPEKMNYQAVIRNAEGALVVSQPIGMQISILQGGATGVPVYVETQTPGSNANGLVTIEIGTGTVVSGDLASIDWGNDRYFMKTETDPTGGTDYTISGTSQLLSVPYAMHAKQAGSVLSEHLEIKNGSLKIADGTEGTGKVFTSDANGKGTWENPVDHVMATPGIHRGPLPVGANCPVGGSYTAPETVLEPGVYIYTLYSCAGQIGQSGAGFGVGLVFLSGSGDGSGTWHDFNSGTCGHYYTGVVRVASTSNVAVQYSSYSGSSFTVPGANSEQITFFKIN